MRGPILFIGGICDNEIYTLDWAERVRMAVPMGLPIGLNVKIEPQIEQSYRLEGFTSEGGAIFYVYLFEDLTPSEVYERIDLPPHQPECEFKIPEWELHKRLGVPKEAAKERIKR